MSVDVLAAYAGGSAVQAALVVATVRRSGSRLLRALRHRAFALLPLASIVAVAFGLRAWPAMAGAVAVVALALVPLLALAAAARAGRLAFVVTLALVPVAIAERHGLLGELAALELIGASCMLLGALLVELTPARWLGAGIAAMALADLVLVSSGLLAPGNDALDAAGAGHGLPQLQRVVLGPLTMGYGDLFLPALVGALLSARARSRRWVGAFTFGFALLAGLGFLFAEQLPATVPVALALLVVEGVGALRGHRARRRAVALTRSGGRVSRWHAAGAWETSIFR